MGNIAGKRKHCKICGMGQGKGHDNAEQNKLLRMAWRALSNLPVFWKCRILICLWYLNFITGYNWIEGKLPKTGMPKGWIWGVEQGRGFCRGVLRLVEWTKWKSEEIVKCSLRNETDDERLNEWMNLPQHWILQHYTSALFLLHRWKGGGEMWFLMLNGVADAGIQVRWVARLLNIMPL